MSPPIGHQVAPQPANEVLARARARASMVPDLLVEAQRVANNVFAGWHGRRRRGIGENFWQFRPYVPGENFSAIDWRRSAREDHIYVKDREWQASHTIWLWVDESPSMQFKSDIASVSKQSRAMVLALAMAELLARSGERIGWLGVSPPIVNRHAAERLANTLAFSVPQTKFPNTDMIKDHAEVLIFSDFLDNDESHPVFNEFSAGHIRAHLTQIVDPAETQFPYAGRVEFQDPETGRKINLGSAQTLKHAYSDLFNAHTEKLADACKLRGWSHVLHHTDKLASGALQSLHVNLSHSPFRENF